MLKGNAVVSASNITTNVNFCQYTVSFGTAAPAFGTGGAGLTFADTQFDLIDSVYYVIQFGTITTSAVVNFQILLPNNTWMTLNTPNATSGAATPMAVTGTTLTNYNGSLNLGPATTSPAIAVPALGVRMTSTITSATITYAAFFITKR